MGLDTFAVSTALGLHGLPADRRFRISVVLSSFETVMPILGMLIGRGLGSAIGDAADYVAIAVLGAVGCWMLLGDERGEEERIGRLAAGQGLALFALGLSVSLDELAMGFSIGLLHLSPWLAVVLIGVQAFVVSQLGMRLGARGGELLQDRAERVAGIALLALALLLLAEKLAS